MHDQIGHESVELIRQPVRVPARKLPPGEFPQISRDRQTEGPVCGRVVAGEPYRQVRDPVREALRVPLRREFEDHGGLAFAGGKAAEAEDGRGRVEHPARARGCDTVEAALQLRFEEAELGLVAEVQPADGFVIRSGLLQQGHGDAPAFLRRRVAAGLLERLEGARPGEPVDVCQQEFAAPDGAVVSVAGAVERDADDGLEEIVLRHAGERVGVVVLELRDRYAQFRAQFARHFGGVVQRVLVADDEVRLDFQ